MIWYEGTGTASTDRRYLGQDERGSIISVSDSSGVSLGLNKYDEYGKPGRVEPREISIYGADVAA